MGPSTEAAVSPSSVLCLFPNVDMFSGAMGRRGRQAEGTADERLGQQEQRPPQEILRNLRPQGRIIDGIESQTD